MRLDQSEMRSQIRNIRQYCGDLFLYTEDLERVPYDRRLNSDSGDEWEVPSPSTDFYTITATDSLKDISNRTCTLFDKFILQVPDITMGKSIVTLDEEDIIRSFDGGWNANNEIVESLEEKLKDHFNFKHWCFLLVLEASRFRWWINETLVKKVHSQVILEENQREYLKKIYILLWAGK